MPNPVFSDVHLSHALTSVSIAYLQDQSNYIADQVFPPVGVVHQADKYFKWNKSDFFRDDVQLRSDATESAGTGFNLTTGSYSASVYALHKDIGDQTRRNADPAVDVDVATVKALTQKMLIARDRIFVRSFMTTGIWGTAGSTDVSGAISGTPGTTTTPYWSDDANGDPFSDIAAAQTTILQNTGFEANKLVLTWPVYQALRKHPLVIDRIKYTMRADSSNITPDLLAGAFDVEKVVVSKAVYNSASEGNADSFSFVAGKHALLCYSNPSPGLMQPSAGYIFPWQGLTGLNTMGVRTLQIPMPWLGNNTVRTEVEMAFDMVAVGTDLGVFFNGIVA